MIKRTDIFSRAPYSTSWAGASSFVEAKCRSVKRTVGVKCIHRLWVGEFEEKLEGEGDDMTERCIEFL